MASFDAITAPPHETPALPECVISYAVAGDRSGAAIWAAHMADGRPCAHLVATRTGSAWLAPTILDLASRGPRLIVADDAGHTRTVTATLTTAGLDVQAASPARYATACDAWLIGVADATLAHDGAPELRSQLEGAALRPMAGGKGFSDAHSAGPIDHLKAAALATFEAAHLPAVVPIW